MAAGWKDTLRSTYCMPTENQALEVENDEIPKKSQLWGRLARATLQPRRQFFFSGVCIH